MIMEKKIYEMTNAAGRKFLDGCMKSAHLIGVEVSPSNITRKEFSVVYVANGQKYVCVLPDAGTKNDGSCIFGTLERFAIITALERAGLKIVWRSGNPMWPVWYTDKDEFARFKREYDNIKRKYS